MKNPPHPGRLIKHECLEPLNLSITRAADILGVTRLTLSNLVNGRNGVSPEMVIEVVQGLRQHSEGMVKVYRWIMTLHKLKRSHLISR